MHPQVEQKSDQPPRDLFDALHEDQNIASALGNLRRTSTEYNPAASASGNPRRDDRADNNYNPAASAPGNQRREENYSHKDVNLESSKREGSRKSANKQLAEACNLSTMAYGYN